MGELQALVPNDSTGEFSDPDVEADGVDAGSNDQDVIQLDSTGAALYSHGEESKLA